MQRKMMSLLFSLVLVAGLLAACSDSGSPAATSTPTPSSVTSTPAATEDSGELTGSLITEDPLELSIFLHYGNRFVFDDNWDIFQGAAELTNISLRGIASANTTNSSEAANLMMATGELADIMHFFHAARNTWGPDGALIDLRDLIEEHAPNIKRILEEDPRLAHFAASPDGNMYMVPQPNREIIGQAWLIREDWLDDLGLPLPDTYLDYYDTLKAFKEADPARVPYMKRDTGGVRDLLAFWDLPTGQWKAVDGEVQYVPAHPNLKIAAQELAGWYSEGLIDQEIYTRGGQAREILFSQNLAGSTHDFMQSTTGFNAQLQDSIPGFRMVPMPPPQNINGERKEFSTAQFYTNHGWGISTQSEHPVEAIKYLDFWFSEEGMMLSTYGIEGETYVYDAAGELQLTDSTKDGNILENMYRIGAHLEFPREHDFAFSRFTVTEEAMEGINLYLDSGWIQEAFPPQSFSQSDKNRYDDLSNGLSTYSSEQFQRWVMGAEVLDDAVWDRYIDQLHRLGLEEFTELAQKAYDEYIEAVGN